MPCQIAELLLHNGAHVNTQDKTSAATPLHRAASRYIAVNDLKYFKKYVTHHAFLIIFMKAILFCGYIASFKNLGLGELLKVMQTLDCVTGLHNCLSRVL